MNRVVHASFNAVTGFNPSAFAELSLCATSRPCDQPIGSSVRMGPFMGTHFNPDGAGGKWVKDHTIGANARPSPLAAYLQRFEILDCGPEHLTVLTIKRNIKVGLRGVVGAQPLEHRAFYDQRTILPLQPDFLHDDHRRIDPLKLDVGHVGWRPKRGGTTSEEQRHQQHKATDFQGMVRVAQGDGLLGCSSERGMATVHFCLNVSAASNPSGFCRGELFQPERPKPGGPAQRRLRCRNRRMRFHTAALKLGFGARRTCQH